MINKKAICFKLLSKSNTCTLVDLVKLNKQTKKSIYKITLWNMHTKFQLSIDKQKMGL